MQEVARLDATAANLSKTTFLSSLSHELRTPLHGILGSTHLMRNSSLDSFQVSMVDSIAIDSKSNKFSCNVGFVTEEVVQTLIIGETPYSLTAESNLESEMDISDYETLGYRLSASSYGRMVMNLVGNALKFTAHGYIHVSVHSEDVDEKSGTLVLRISDSGIGIDSHFLERAFQPFRKQDQHTMGTGVGLSVVKRILEDVGGCISISSEASMGTEVVLKLPLERLDKEESRDPRINPLCAAIADLMGRRVCILHEEASSRENTPAQVSHKRNMKRYVDTLSATLSSVLKLDVRHSDNWDGTDDDTEIIICPEVSFDSLHKIRSNAAKTGKSCPPTIFIAMDILEAEALRCDARVTSRESIVESIVQPCGPYKLSVAIKACLNQYNHGNSPSALSKPASHLVAGTWSPPETAALSSDFSSRFALDHAPPLTMRKKTPSTTQDTTAPGLAAAPSPSTDALQPASDSKRLCIAAKALIVDDNPINRRLLAAWMKKHQIAFQEAKDGQQALDLYKAADGAFATVLMDISMPVMDGMTATRLMRDFEKDKTERQASHIIALTGLTSATAKLEAWTSGVDDFLTKPVDFARLSELMRVGRGGQGTGFVKHHPSMVP
ncbi:hypothetical protein ACEQ8H_002563 [Pleosporales sp. CAS-2024a]